MSETEIKLRPAELRHDVQRVLASVQECLEGDFAIGGLLEDAPSITIQLETVHCTQDRAKVHITPKVDIIESGVSYEDFRRCVTCLAGVIIG